MKNGMPAWLRLALIALVAGLLLGLTNELTAPIIAAQAEAQAPGARQIALPQADAFEEIAAGAGLDSCLKGTSGGALVGYVGQATVKGYGGPIEVTLGVDTAGVITGISVGGANFAETTGLGAKVQEPAFTDQFAGLQGPLVLSKDVDAVTSATISSTAVVTGVNTIYEALKALPAQ